MSRSSRILLAFAVPNRLHHERLQIDQKKGCQKKRASPQRAPFGGASDDLYIYLKCGCPERQLSAKHTTYTGPCNCVSLQKAAAMKLLGRVALSNLEGSSYPLTHHPLQYHSFPTSRQDKNSSPSDQVMIVTCCKSWFQSSWLKVEHRAPRGL